MTERPLLSGEHAALALLTLRPMHGYEIARYFQEQLATVLPLEQSLLYAYVKTLEKRGLIESFEQRVGNRPPRKVYMLTENGQQAAWAWLRRPVERMREVRVELLVKLFVLHEMHSSIERQLLAEQVDVCERYLERAQEHREGATGFAALVAGARYSAAEATLRWLREYSWQLEGHDA